MWKKVSRFSIHACFVVGFRLKITGPFSQRCFYFTFCLYSCCELCLGVCVLLVTKLNAHSTAKILLQIASHISIEICDYEKDGEGFSCSYSLSSIVITIIHIIVLLSASLSKILFTHLAQSQILPKTHIFFLDFLLLLLFLYFFCDSETTHFCSFLNVGI